MQTFYDQLTSQGEIRAAEKSWISQVTQTSLEQISVFRDNSLAWNSWDTEEA